MFAPALLLLCSAAAVSAQSCGVVPVGRKFPLIATLLTETFLFGYALPRDAEKLVNGVMMSHCQRASPTRAHKQGTLVCLAARAVRMLLWYQQVSECFFPFSTVHCTLQ